MDDYMALKTIKSTAPTSMAVPVTVTDRSRPFGNEKILAWYLVILGAKPLGLQQGVFMTEQLPRVKNQGFNN